MSDTGSGFPWFPFYPADFLADENVKLMDLDEVGAYCLLLFHGWREGSIPADPKLLARLLGVSRERMAELWRALDPCFIVAEDHPDRLVNPRLERERAILLQRSEKARQSASARWNKQRRKSFDDGEIMRTHDGGICEPDANSMRPTQGPLRPLVKRSRRSGKEGDQTDQETLQVDMLNEDNRDMRSECERNANASPEQCYSQSQSEVSTNVDTAGQSPADRLWGIWLELWGGDKAAAVTLTTKRKRALEATARELKKAGVPVEETFRSIVQAQQADDWYQRKPHLRFPDSTLARPEQRNRWLLAVLEEHPAAPSGNGRGKPDPQDPGAWEDSYSGGKYRG